MCLGSINMCMGLARHILIRHLGRHEKRNTVILLYTACIFKPAIDLRSGPFKSPWSGVLWGFSSDQSLNFCCSDHQTHQHKALPKKNLCILVTLLIKISLSLSLSLILQSHTFGTSKAQPLGAFTVVKQKANLIRSLNKGRSWADKSGRDLIPIIQEWEKPCTY
jgi:hypothetical protein